MGWFFLLIFYHNYFFCHVSCKLAWLFNLKMEVVKRDPEYLKFDPRRIDKNIPYRKVNKTPQRRITKEGLWPYVAKMQPGDVYIYFDASPKSLRNILYKLCKEYTGGSIAENNLKLEITAANDGVIMLKI